MFGLMSLNIIAEKAAVWERRIRRIYARILRKK